MSKRTVLVASTLAAVLGVVGLGGCGKKKDDPKPAEAAPTELAANAKPPQAIRPPGVRRSVAAITLDEVKAMLPALDGARVVKATTKAQVGERIEAAYCYEKGELAGIADQIKAKLTAAGWPEIRVRQNPQVSDRIGFTGHKPPYILTGTVQRAMLPDCLSSKGFSYVAIGVHKIDVRDGTMMGTPGEPLPGAAGLGRPQPMGPMGARKLPAPPAPAPAPAPATP